MGMMVECVATREWSGWQDCLQSWDDNADVFHHREVIANTDVLTAFQICYRRTRQPILMYCHDDLMILEKGWDTRVIEEFEDPGVGLVGFAGGRGHGTLDLYEAPYRLSNLARQNFLSNMRDAEIHGQRFTGSTDVAVLDGMALFVRRSVLDCAGGWPVNKPIGYWLYSEWLCCETRRQARKIRLVGVKIDHLGGKSSGHIPRSPTYEEAHKYFYDTNRDVLPYRVSE